MKHNQTSNIVIINLLINQLAYRIIIISRLNAAVFTTIQSQTFRHN